MDKNIKFGTISEGKSFEHDFERLPIDEKEAFVGCYLEGIGKKEDFQSNISFWYSKLPVYIKNDILTLTIHNEVVQAKIIDWIRDEYLRNAK